MYKYMYLLTGELYMHLCILTSIHKELTAELQVCFMMSTKTGVRLKDSCKDSLISLSAAGKYITYCIHLSIISFESKDKTKITKILKQNKLHIYLKWSRKIDVY